MAQFGPERAPGRQGSYMVAFLLRPVVAEAQKPTPGRQGSHMVAFLLRPVVTEAPGPAPGRLGSQMVAFLLRPLLAEAPEPAPARLGSQMVAFVMKSSISRGTGALLGLSRPLLGLYWALLAWPNYEMRCFVLQITTPKSLLVRGGGFGLQNTIPNASP